jgi:hypothetical protein
LASAQRFFAVFYQLPAWMLIDLPYSVWTNVGHLYVVLSKLSLVQCDGWDQAYVTRTLDFHDALERLSERIDQATQFAHQSTASTTGLPRMVPIIFTSVRGKIADIRVTHESRKAEQVRRTQQQASTVAETQIPSTQDGLQQPTLPDDLVIPESVDFFEFLDEPFWAQNWI